MKIQTQVSEVEMINAGDSHLARIKQSPKAFSILSDKLYSDKILAIVRELSCNAHDAHAMNGNQAVPFEVRLPNTLEPIFYVKDYGPGLSEDQVYNLYMTYFESTKTESNDFIGQLGLGSKSPFSYAATFTVESRQNGIKKVYACYKNEQLHPAVSKMGEGPTDEKDGLTVQIAVKANDIQAFKTAARNALRYFPVQPNIVGIDNDYFKIDEVVYSGLQGADWKVREYSSYHGPRVVQGCVSYPIDVNILDDMQTEYPVSQFSNLHVDLFVPIGAVDIAPSREALSYDSITVKNLVDIFKRLTEEFLIGRQAEIDALPTLWQAKILVNKINSATTAHDKIIVNDPNNTALSSRGGRMLTCFTYKGKPINNDSFQILASDNPPSDLKLSIVDTTHKTLRLTYSSGSIMLVQKAPDVDQIASVGYGESTVVIVCNDNRPKRSLHKNNRKVALLLSTSSKFHGQRSSAFGSNIGLKYTRAILIQDIGETGNINKKSLDKLLDLLGNPPVLNMLDIPEAPAAPRNPSSSVYQARAKDELLMWTGYVSVGRWSSSNVSRNSYEVKTVDLSEGGYYLELDRHEPTLRNVQASELDYWIAVAKDLGYLPKNATIYGINSRKLASTIKEGDWIDLNDVIDQVLVDDRLVDTTKLRLAQLYIKDAMNTRNSCPMVQIVKAIDQVAPYINETVRDDVLAVLNGVQGITFNTDELEVAWYYDRIEHRIRKLAYDKTPEDDRASFSWISKQSVVDAFDTRRGEALKKFSTLQFVNLSAALSEEAGLKIIGAALA